MLKKIKEKLINKSLSPPTIESYLKIKPSLQRKTGGIGAVNRTPNYGLPLVSVYTIVLNRKDTLTKTIESVIAQTYKNIEYIIIDGASTDGTLEIIKKYESKINLWISEQDSGTSDATNKAIAFSKGKIIASVASDDWMDPDFIQIAVESMNSTKTDFVFGDLRIFEGENLVSINKGDVDYEKKILLEWPNLSYSTMVINRKCYEKAGLLDLRYLILNDYEWALRAHLLGFKGHYNSKLIGNFRLGGVSSVNEFRSLFEKIVIMKKNNLITIKNTLKYSYVLIRYLIGYLAIIILPKTIYQKLKKIKIELI